MNQEKSMDSAKINQLFEKISKYTWIQLTAVLDDSNNLEIEERSLKNIQ